MKQKIKTTHNLMEKIILNIKKNYRNKISTIKSKVKNNCASGVIKIKKLGWGGRVARLPR